MDWKLISLRFSPNFACLQPKIAWLSVDVATLSGLGCVYALQRFSKAMFEPRLNLLLDRPVYGPTDTELQ